LVEGLRVVLFSVEVLLDVRIDWGFEFVLAFVVGFVGRVSLPSSELLLAKLVLFILFVLAFNADAEFSAFHSLFEAKAILLLAV
jgi:hypothetical protein